jgi:glycerophosphoryl diester phosphodiesterase
MYKLVFKNFAMSMLLASVLSVIFIGTGVNAQEIDVQGHRGTRGLMPENTLPAFARALSIGVSTLELDLAVTRDNVVVVSHNPRLNKEITRNKAGKWLREDGAVIRETDYDDLKQYDVGAINPTSRYASRFPDQTAVDATPIPTLDQVFELVKRSGNTLVRFNVETKLYPQQPDLTPSPEIFVKLLLKVIQRHKMSGRVTIQSFDWRTLQVVQKLAPEIPTAYLSVAQPWLDTLQYGKSGPSPWLAGFDIDDFQQSVPRAIKAAGGRIWSPYHKEVTRKNIDLAHALGLKVKVWTPNNPARMKQLIAMGVDGIITDYPDRLRTVVQQLGLSLPPATPSK